MSEHGYGWNALRESPKQRARKLFSECVQEPAANPNHLENLLEMQIPGPTHYYWKIALWSSGSCVLNRAGVFPLHTQV